MNAFANLQRLFAALALCACAVMWVGCPQTNPGEPPTSDGGETVPEAPPALTQCPAGARCIFIDDQAIRSCAILLKGQTGDASEIVFADSVLGRSKRQAEKIGLVFIAQKHEAFASDKPLVSVSQATDITVSKMDCYDAKGVRIDAPNVRLEGK